MKVINPDVQEVSMFYENFWKSIEFAARVCYNCTDKCSRTNSQAEEFVRTRLLATDGGVTHGRALEFGTVYLTIPWYRIDKILWYKMNHWSRSNWGKVTTNYRVIYENNRENDLKWLCWSKEHYQRRALLWTISRGIADEFRTHTSVSSLMMSTRYCDMVGSKFDGQLTFVAPRCYSNGKGVDDFELAWRMAERRYRSLREDADCSAQESREVLPLSIMTKLVQCAFDDEWARFFALRAEDSEHNHPHPDAKYIASIGRRLLRL